MERFRLNYSNYKSPDKILEGFLHYLRYVFFLTVKAVDVHNKHKHTSLWTKDTNITKLPQQHSNHNVDIHNKYRTFTDIISVTC